MPTFLSFCLATSRNSKIVCKGRVALQVVICLVGTAWACLGMPNVSPAQPPVHYQYSLAYPPGVIGQWQLRRGGPLSGFHQPVQIKAPHGASVSLANQGTFDPPRANPVLAGLLIGEVYRLKVTNIPFRAGKEVFPTIEIIDRLYPPAGLEYKFPIPVEITRGDLELAIQGKFVTRIIYLEDPNHASPVPRQRGEQPWLDVKVSDNPLQIADELGRPVAILRIGSRVPASTGAEETFMYGSPPWLDLYEEPGTEDAMIQDTIAGRLSNRIE